MSAEPIPHEDRRTYLGSHDTSAIAGDNPWSSPIQIYMNKLGLVEDNKPNEAMLWGLRTQAINLAEFAERMGVDLEGERFIRHKKLKWFGGTPDATIKGKKEGVDAKLTRYLNPREWGEEMTDQVPRHILWQCHHFLTLMNYNVWYVSVLFGGQEQRVYRVERDWELSDIIIEMDGDFWREHVEKQNPPEIDASPSAKAYLDRTYKDHGDEIRLATDDELGLLNELRKIKERAKTTNELVSFYENRLREAIGDDLGLAHGSIGTVTWKEQKGRKGLDKKALQEDLPEIAEKYTKEGKPHRVLRTNWNDDE